MNAYRVTLIKKVQGKTLGIKFTPSGSIRGDITRLRRALNEIEAYIIRVGYENE